MKYNLLGKSNIKVSIISMGCWAIAGGNVWGAQDDNEAIKAIQTAYENDIILFDTAEVYGNGYSEELLGKAIKSFRKNIVIASKVLPANLKPNDLKKSCENSLRRLNTDYIDIYYIHWPNKEIPIADTLEAMQELKKEGKIRSICCSNFGKKDLTELLQYENVDANQLPYNLIFRAIEYDIQPICLEKEVSIICYSPIAQGLLSGKYRSPEDVPEGRAKTRHFSNTRIQARHQEKGVERETFATIDKIRKIAQQSGNTMVQLALAWLKSREGVASVVVGARNPEQIKENVRAAEIKLSVDVLRELTQVTENLKINLGKNPDMWESKSRYN